MASDWISVEQAVQSVLDAGMTELANGSSGKQILYDNDPDLGTKANTETPVPKEGHAASEWARVTIENAAAPPGQQEIGGASTITHQEGRLHARLFVPVGSGTDRLHTIANQLIGLVRRQSIGGALFRDAIELGRGASPDNQWYGLSISVPFYFEFLPS